MKIAMIVNDMGEINLDASEIKHSRLIQEEAKMVELHNGCICCTLRGDLLKTVKALSEEQVFDYLVIESTGISEPLPVAQTFVMDVDDVEDEHEHAMEEEEKGGSNKEEEEQEAEKDPKELLSLSHFAKLDTMITVVDCLNMYDVLQSLETLAEQNSTKMIGNTGVRSGGEVGDGAADAQEEEGDGDGDKIMLEKTQQQEQWQEEGEFDDRSITQLWLDQIEFANVIVLSKAHLVKDAKAVAETKALLRRLNPSAKVIVSSKPFFADISLNNLVNTGLFDMEKAETSAGWMQELQRGTHTPETEEYGISSVMFRNNERPFHPSRLNAVLNGMGNYKSSEAASTMRVVAAAEAAKAGKSPQQEDEKKKKALSSGPLNGVVRAKGDLWVATANAHPVLFHSAGRRLDLIPDGLPFLSVLPEADWNEDDREEHAKLVSQGQWHPVNGDRHSKIVFIGINLDKPRILRELEGALLTDEEMAGGVTAWKELEDVFFGGEYFELSNPEPEEEEEEGGEGKEAAGKEEGGGGDANVC